jgi:hypothetical protein
MVDPAEVKRLRARRAAAQLLAGPRESTPTAIVSRLLAVQAQDLRSARLALRARGRGFTAAGVERALTVERSLVVGWLCRGTLHLVLREDYAWLLGLTAPRRAAGSRRRLGQEGVSEDEAGRAVAIVERALTAEGPLGRPELAERIAAHGIRTEGQATPHLLGLAAARGVAVLGPVRDGRQLFAPARDWLGEEPLPHLTGSDRDAALAELARRYLAGHGPATAADLATWAGLPLRDARAGLSTIAPELAEPGGDLVELAGGGGGPGRPAGGGGPGPPAGGGGPGPPAGGGGRPDRLPEGDLPARLLPARLLPARLLPARLLPARLLPARLLPSFDPYLLGWEDRSFAVPSRHARRVHPGGGILRAVATVDGVAAATWTARRRGDSLNVEVEPFAPLAPEAAAALQAEAKDVERFEAVR